MAYWVSKDIPLKTRKLKMSADNGIYILETLVKGNGRKFDLHEYRVRELQCIENLKYDPTVAILQPTEEYHSVHEYRPEDKEHCAYQKAYRNKYHSDNPDVQISNARKMWRNCKVFSDKGLALLYAAELEDKSTNECGFQPEYGISFIRIDRVF